MSSVTNIRSISYLKRHAAQISEDLEMNGNPFFITQNGDASMVIESVKQYQEKESLIAALKIMPWVKKTVCRAKVCLLLTRGLSCWLPAKVENNRGHHPSRCAG